MGSRNRRIRDNTIRVPKTRNILAKVLICVVMLAFISIGSYKMLLGYQYWQRNKEIKLGYVQVVEQLKQEHQQLKDEIKLLESNLLTQERLARELGYIRLGETVYKFVPKADNSVH